MSYEEKPVTDSLPLPGPERCDCPCGCGKYGVPKKTRSWHVRGCPCPKCRGGRNRKRGLSNQRRFAKSAGITTGRSSRQSANEENWPDRYRWEVKSGRQVDPVVTRYELARKQSEANRPVGDNRPFVMGVEPTEALRPSLIVVEAEVWRSLNEDGPDERRHL